MNRNYGQRFNVATGFSVTARPPAVVADSEDTSKSFAPAPSRRSTLILSQPGGGKLIPSQLVEKQILSATSRYLKTAERLGVTPPMVLMVTIHAVKGHAMATNSAWQNFNPTNLIDRDTLLLPDVLIEEFSTRPTGF